MKNFSRLKFLFVLFILLLILPLIVHAGQFKVFRVYDGDTITVLENGKKTRVRLVGIDSPEMSRGKNKPGSHSVRNHRNSFHGWS
jgi:endonuclease YncB( thermonuclease family)